MRRILRSADVQAGLVFIGIAALTLWLTSGLRMGTAMRMGPGYMPTLLSYLLLGIGILTVVLGALKRDAATERWFLRPLLAVSAAMVVFAYGIADLGLFVTTILLVVAASVATPKSRPIEVAAVALGLATFSTALFVRALGLPMPAWPAFLVS